MSDLQKANSCQCDRKVVLLVASVASMIYQFNMDNIRILSDMGYDIEIACNFLDGNTCTKSEILSLKQYLDSHDFKYYQIDFVRNPVHIRGFLKAYNQLYHLCQNKKYHFIHCHSPIGGVISRIVGHRMNIPVAYTAHGFHFFDGAPLHNWMLYYPLELFLSKWTKVLITINEEDYLRVKNRFHAQYILYIRGIGININAYAMDEHKRQLTRNRIRAKLGLVESEKMLLSVGELTDRKNHEIVLNALKQINCPELKYYICGIGDKLNSYKQFVKEHGIEKQVIFLGFRNDLRDLYASCDLFVFPSRQEGMPVALMEAIASGAPVICSNIRGNNELIRDADRRFPATDINCLVNKLVKWQNGELDCFSAQDRINLQPYDISNIENDIRNAYQKMEQ